MGFVRLSVPQGNTSSVLPKLDHAQKAAWSMIKTVLAGTRLVANYRENFMKIYIETLLLVVIFENLNMNMKKSGSCLQTLVLKTILIC